MRKSFLIPLVVLPMLLRTAGAQEAKEILDVCGVKGGLVVAIGWKTPALLAELRADDSYLVHGLHPDPAKVVEARERLQEEGLYKKSRIFATDMNVVVLQKAKEGIFPLGRMQLYTKSIKSPARSNGRNPVVRSLRALFALLRYWSSSGSMIPLVTSQSRRNITAVGMTKTVAANCVAPDG